ncbi:MAG: carboxypeptidase-like regulatory domain-containing protein [Flavipsychrobacter sp.]
MKKHKPIQISIPQPCSEDWNKMTPQEQGRFCNACQKCVVDFTGFNDHQLYNYLRAHKDEKVCGRFRNTQLNRAIHIPPQPHSRLYRIAIAVGLTLAIISTAEVYSFAKAPLIEYSLLDKPQEDSTTNNSDTTIIKGKVVDEHGEPIINASVQLIKDGIIIGGTVTNYDGDFLIDAKSVTNKTSLKISYVGFCNTAIEVRSTSEPIIITLKLLPKEQLDNIIIHTGGVVKITTIEPVEEDTNLVDNRPLIDTLNPSPMNKTISGDKINKMAH